MIAAIEDQQHAGLSARAWVEGAIAAITADFHRSADTHLIPLPIPALTGVDLYLKDESTHPSGSLKHRLARSLFLYGLCNGFIQRDTTIVESSSGSTAISEAYFARLLGLPFVAVVPESIAPEKIRQIEFYGGQCRRVPPLKIYDEARQLAQKLGGHYMDQFTYAERATDWRGNNNIAESLFAQMEKERFAVPHWVVVGAGTGGTSATIGRYIRYRPELCARTRLCVVDPERSVFFDHFAHRSRSETTAGSARLSSRIEGIGRPRVEPSFCMDIVDRMLRIPDAASMATLWWLQEITGRRFGGSTGTATFGALRLMAEMAQRGESGSVVSIIGDSGERYLDSYFNPQWLAQEKLDLAPYLAALREFSRSGRWQET